MTRFRKVWTFAALSFALAATIGCGPVQAQGWPSRPVKVIMATAAGSAPDVTARVVTDRLAQI